MSFIYCHLNFHANLLRPWPFPLSIYYAIHNTSAQNLSKINAMINPLVVESLTVKNTTRSKKYIICTILYQIILKSVI